MPKSKKFRMWDAPSQYNGNLSERIHIMVTPKTKREMKVMLETGEFPNISEFCRFAIKSALYKYHKTEKWKKKLTESDQEE